MLMTVATRLSDFVSERTSKLVRDHVGTRLMRSASSSIPGVYTGNRVNAPLIASQACTRHVHGLGVLVVFLVDLGCSRMPCGRLRVCGPGVTCACQGPPALGVLHGLACTQVVVRRCVVSGKLACVCGLARPKAAGRAWEVLGPSPVKLVRVGRWPHRSQRAAYRVWKLQQPSLLVSRVDASTRTRRWGLPLQEGGRRLSSTEDQPGAAATCVQRQK